ncbi:MULTISPECIES: hypothetical protein [Acinetobacter]|jgi:hypothetical protein|uniref:hypothetical protein n=1 Tax=Acinetobacter TaxID=469 RepID=UPI000575441C|nr:MULTISPECIES: hypothetical protein [Acinetobacter]MDR3028900.1 hypothetical protein [Acinetobacter sp.]MDV8157684.1 hypothetical protein [Acinetobacter bereziniae]CEI54934.1 hypothetical protein [Acinetobacter bereziniae]
MWIKQQTLDHIPQQLLSRLKPNLIGLLAALTLGLSLSGCVTTPNPVKQAADKLVGQHVNKAIDIFGSPTYRVPASKLGGSAMWENSIVSQHVVQQFVQTGSEYAGQRVVGQTGGQGVVGAIYENQYRPTGYYQNAVQERAQYLCNITALTGPGDIITNIMVIGCKQTKDGL